MERSRELDRILVVDDDFSARTAIAEVLSQAGYQVEQAEDGASALAALGRFRPDLIVLDLALPDADGFDVLARVHETDETRNVPVLIASGERLDEGSVVRALTGGACDFLRRPFGAAELLARVGVALRTRRAQLDLERLGTTDPLTGLWNRRAFFSALERERRRAERNRQPLSVVAIDVDRFKSVNDAYGHAAGDRVLQEISAVLEAQCRVTDVVGRIGGEEFAIVLPSTGALGAQLLAEKLRAAIAGARIEVAPGVLLPVTASFGVATGEGDDLLGPEEGLALLARADGALYDAKRAGRDRIEMATGG